MKPVEVKYPKWDAVEEDTYTSDFTPEDVKRGFNREPMEPEGYPSRAQSQRSYGKEQTS